MPTPLPRRDTAKLTPPDGAEVYAISRAVGSAVAPATGMTQTQRLLMDAVFFAMTEHHATLDAPRMTAQEFGECLAQRTIEFRSRIVQIMILLGLVLRPIPEEVANRIASFASELLVEERMVDVAREFAAGSLGLAAFDFERNGYTATWSSRDAESLHSSKELASAWDTAAADESLAARWQSLEGLPEASLGRRVADFYRARGFAYPGNPGSAPPLLAQHDWVHVLADYGTTVESELEVFAFIARANDDLRAFSLLAMVVSLFETGYLRSGAGLFESSPGHLSGQKMANRVADAMSRGARCEGSIDFLRTDWFDLAELSVETIREHFGVPAKSADAVGAGSVGPWERGGISPFQVRSGQLRAESQGLVYEGFGAEVGTEE